MRMRILDSGTDKQFNLKYLNRVFEGSIKLGCNVLMDYTYNRTIVYNEKVYINMLKAFIAIAEDLSIEKGEDALFKVNMEERVPVTLSVYIESECVLKTEFTEVVL